MVKKTHLILAICLLLATGVYAQKISVLDFETQGSVTEEDIVNINALSTRFRNMVVQTKTFEVMERNNIESLKQELKLQMTDDFEKSSEMDDEEKRFLRWLEADDGSEFDEKAIAKAGRMIGAEYIVQGDIGKVKSTYIIDVRMVHCESSQIVDGYSETYKGDIDELIILMEKVAKRMAGIEEKSKLWMYLTGGGVVTIATVAILLMGAEEDAGLPEPPGPPE